MTIQVTVSVGSFSKTSDSELRKLIDEIERIKSYDGTTIRVNVEYPRISMFSKPQPLYQVIEQMLAEADAAASPHYTASPRGLPYTIRVEAAMAYFRTASPEFRREAEYRSLGGPARNRQEFIRINREALNYFYPSRGPLETEFLRLLGKQCCN